MKITGDEVKLVEEVDGGSTLLDSKISTEVDPFIVWDLVIISFIVEPAVAKASMLITLGCRVPKSMSDVSRIICSLSSVTGAAVYFVMTVSENVSVSEVIISNSSIVFDNVDHCVTSVVKPVIILPFAVEKSNS